MKRFAVSFLGVLMIVMAVSGCTGKKPAEQYVSEQLNCSLPAAEKAEASDTHGGFHGEGEYAAAIRFDTVHGAQLAERLQNTDGWKALPLEEELAVMGIILRIKQESRRLKTAVIILLIDSRIQKEQVFYTAGRIIFLWQYMIQMRIYCIIVR